MLLKNDAHLLPIARPVKSVAVIGVDATEARLGGYSGPGNGSVSILDGIRRAVGPVATVRFVPGPGRTIREFETVPASALASVPEGRRRAVSPANTSTIRALQGPPRLTRTDTRVDFRWTLNSPGRGIPFDWYSARWTGTLTAPAAGVARIGVEGNDGYRLYLDEQLVIDNWKKQSFGKRIADVALGPGTSSPDPVGVLRDHGQRAAATDVGCRRRRRLARGDRSGGCGRQGERRRDCRGWRRGGRVSRSRLAGLARPPAGAHRGRRRNGQADRRRAHRRQRDHDAVARLGRRRARRLVSGEAGGDAVADVLFGDANPSGRLPITFPVAEGQLPLSYNHKPTGRGDDYVDLTGQALFPFGFGLSYTTFEYSDLSIDPADVAPTRTATIRFAVRNSGRRSGDEVVQLYVRDVLATVARPVMELKKFRRVHLEPGERRELVFELQARELRMLDRDLRWVVEPGAFRIMIGSSSKDIRLRGHLNVR